MKKYLPLFVLLFAVSSVCAQFQRVEVEQVDNGGAVAGRTYRIYIVLANDSDQVHMIYGEPAHPMEIKSTKPFFQSPLGGTTSKQIGRKLAKERPEVRYDSFITIGAEDNYDNNTETLLNTEQFDKGGAISTTDGAWYCLPGSKLGYAGADKRVLVAQFTTEGDISGTFNVMGRDKAGAVFQQHTVTFDTKTKKK
ncbi:MAG: hypothetical protein ACOVQ5_02380 [Flavobacteriales bacterium]|jgi:hypothetical protein